MCTARFEALLVVAWEDYFGVPERLAERLVADFAAAVLALVLAEQ